MFEQTGCPQLDDQVFNTRVSYIMMTKLAKFQTSHVYREGNMHVDYVSNLSMAYDDVRWCKTR